MERKKLLLIFSVGILIIFGTIPNCAQINSKTERDKSKYSLVSSIAVMNFELGDMYLDLYRMSKKNNRQNFEKTIEHYKQGLRFEPENVYYNNRLGYAFHLERRLKEASEQYRNVLRLDPPQSVTPEEFELAMRLAPRLYVNPKEFFALEDAVVILHPDQPIIEYSLFWDDDINYPQDNDPTDHEKVWIEYDPENGNIVNVYTYFHRAILSTKKAVEDAREHHDRALINVQWGSHGSLPFGWENIPRDQMVVKYAHIDKPGKIENMRNRYQKHVVSTYNPNHPLSKEWPKKFKGSWQDYITFTQYIDLTEMIRKKKMVMKSRWSNAVIDEYFLDYQFYPKLEWPSDVP
ncbi:MAG: hypothetical protein IIB95_04900 [Candidatus Marinimicrobia bacterium]|nr:hypothetical protein [Candidatus Neomarinimicrobiota bacterium]